MQSKPVIAQFEIYNYLNFFKDGNFTNHTTDYDLPEIVIRDKKRYVWLFNPGCWVEESERTRIINSHCPNLNGYDPAKRIWQIYDGFCTITLSEMLAESFLKKSTFYSQLNKEYCQKFEKPSLIKWFFQKYYPIGYHDHFVMPSNPNVLPAYRYTRNQLLSQSREYSL